LYIDATSVGAADRRFENEVVRLIRAAMHPFELHLERVQVQVRSNPEGHVCQLYAWGERGQTVVVESRSSSRLAAIETAAESLVRTISSRPFRALNPGVSNAREAKVSVPASDDSPAIGSPASRSEVELAAADTARTFSLREGAESRPSRVLLALGDLDASNACLQWARILVDVLQADLDVCRVLPNTSADVAPASKAWLETTRRLLAATRETRRWCTDVLPDANLWERLILAGADSVEQVALRAREREVSWIVMPDLHDGCGRAATALARASGCPVLVARAPTTRSTLLLATDVSEDLDLICNRAAALSEALHAPVLAFHDVGFHAPEARSTVNALTDAWSRVQAERSRAGGHRRLPELGVLLAHGTNRVETILQQARREDAEIVIVGVHEDAAAADDDLAAEVVERAIRSVLVVPANGTREAPQQHLPYHAGGSRRSSTGLALERHGEPSSHGASAYRVHHM
jgi:nucleotide-binding universal stress UspA family protein